MNIFVLNENPDIAAQMHCDKHVPKMIVESAQMLSTAHRLLDGEEYIAPSKSGKRMVKHYRMMHPTMENTLYKAVHTKHPCTIWTMENINNYIWHYYLFKFLAKEFEYRFGKWHASWEKLKHVLGATPRNIKDGTRTPFALAMPDQYKVDDAVQSYHNYYMGDKARFAKWEKGRPVPSWWDNK
tara:strand:+ start:2345 stop:2893 length:549 start_codon:yes stop_codon:yes gene_type:complete